MNNLAPGYLVPYVLSGTVAMMAALVYGLNKALKLAQWSNRERNRSVWTGALLLMAWFVTALLLSWFGFFRGSASRVPTIQYGVLVPILAAGALFWLWPALRRVIEMVPQEWIVGVQAYRVLGLIFVVLYAGRHLPGPFAWPAGMGDVMVGLLAPIVGVAYARGSRNAARSIRAWNLFGLADLIVAVTMGLLTSPSPLQVLAFDAPNELISEFPLVMVPVFLVPVSVLLHLASLHKLRRTETGLHGSGYRMR